MENQRNIFSHCLLVAIILWGIICFIAPFANFDHLSESDYIYYQQIATQYSETGKYTDNSRIKVTKISNREINVVDMTRPFSPSLTFIFLKDAVQVKTGVNLYFIKALPTIFIICMGSILLIGEILNRIFNSQSSKEGC